MDLDVTPDPRFSIEPTGPCSFTVRGELDELSSRAVVRAVTGMVATATPPVLTIDTAELAFLDAAGIRCLLFCRETAAGTGCRLRLVNASPTVLMVLGAVELLDVLGLDEDHAGRAWGLVRQTAAVPRRAGNACEPSRALIGERR